MNKLVTLTAAALAAAALSATAQAAKAPNPFFNESIAPSPWAEGFARADAKPARYRPAPWLDRLWGR